MILEANNMLQVPAILKLVKNIPGTPIDKVKKYFVKSVSSPDAKLYYEKHDNELRAYIYASIEELDGSDVVFIHSCYGNPKAKHIVRQLLNMIEKWGQSKGINDVYMMTNRNPKAYERKYRFEVVSFLMRRRPKT